MTTTRINVTEHDVPAKHVAPMLALVLEHDRPDQIECRPGRLVTIGGPAFYDLHIENITLATVKRLDEYREEATAR